MSQPSADQRPTALKPWRVARRRILTGDRQVDALADEAKQAAGTVLEAAGFHRHDRGGWRLRRRKADPMPAKAGPPLAFTADPAAISLRDRQAEIHTTTSDMILARRARLGRQSEVAARGYFDDITRASPDLEPLLIRINDGDLVARTETALFERLAGEDHLRREATRRHLEAVRRDLLGPAPVAAVERLIVDRAVVCYLALQDVEAELQAWDEKRPRSFIEQRVTAAQRRYLEVLRALDQIRKKTPAVHRLRVRVLGEPSLGEPGPTILDVTPTDSSPGTPTDG